MLAISTREESYRENFDSSILTVSMTIQARRPPLRLEQQSVASKEQFEQPAYPVVTLLDPSSTLCPGHGSLIRFDFNLQVFLYFIKKGRYGLPFFHPFVKR